MAEKACEDKPGPSVLVELRKTDSIQPPPSGAFLFPYLCGWLNRDYWSDRPEKKGGTMRNIIVIISLAIFACGCQPAVLTPEKKQKVELLQAEIAKIENDITTGEKNLIVGTGLIPNLQSARLEVDRLTVSLLRQQIAAIESGAAITISVPSGGIDTSAVAVLESEIKEADITLHKTKAESSLYSGGAFKAMIDVRASLEEFTLSALKQKLLSVKYGLFLPNITNSTEKKEQANSNQPAKPAIEPVKPQVDQPQIEDPGPFDFRHVRWGMSPAEVKGREKATFVGDKNGTLLYTDSINGQNISLAFLFVDGKLWRGTYILSEKFTNKNKYVDVYFAWVDSLKKKYGKPKSENTVWSKNLYKNDISNRGMAYAVGDVESQAEWETRDTSIFSKIDGNNYNISVGVYYSSKSLESSFRNKQKEQEQSKF